MRYKVRYGYQSVAKYCSGGFQWRLVACNLLEGSVEKKGEHRVKERGKDWPRPVKKKMSSYKTRSLGVELISQVQRSTGEGEGKEKREKKVEEDSEVRVGRERQTETDRLETRHHSTLLYQPGSHQNRLETGHAQPNDDWRRGGEKRRDLISSEAKVPLGVGIQQTATKTCATS